MAPEIADDPAADDLFDRIPELPSLPNWWTVCRKAAVVDAVRGDGYRSRRCAAVITFPSISFWPGGRDIDRYGMSGLRNHAISDLPPDRSAQEWLTMALRCSPTRHLAVSLLGECGIAAIWRLNVAAAEAYRTGYPAAASAMLEIAEAAEEAWLRAQGNQALDR
jgi:hypothetical protein